MLSTALDALPFATSASRLTAAYLVAALLVDVGLASQARQVLEQASWQFRGSALVRTKEGGTGQYVSPLSVLMDLCVRGDMHSIPEFAGSPRPESKHLEWLAAPGCEQQVVLADCRDRLVARSLVEHWITLHTAPTREAQKYVLQSEVYVPLIQVIEQQWLRVLTIIQSSAGCSLLRIRPWPNGTNSALSLRYDVDRPILESRIDELESLHNELFGGFRSSWYFFPGETAQRSQQRLLRAREQETGWHLTDTSENLSYGSGAGASHHSSAGSEYWRGQSSSAALDGAGFSYGEFLGGQFSVERPALLASRRDDVDSVRIGGLWLVPISYPLEGSTKDVSLRYFDELLQSFRDQLENGGHVIVTSHPDLNQDLLAQLVTREKLANTWVCTVAEAVERVKLLVAGTIDVTTSERDRIRLAASANVPGFDLLVKNESGAQEVIGVQAMRAGEVREIRLHDVAADCPIDIQ